MLNLILLRGIFIKRDKRAGLRDKGNVFKASTEYDKQRTRYFKRFGLQVIRFTNLDIKDNFDGVCESIINSVKFGLEYCGLDTNILENMLE